MSEQELFTRDELEEIIRRRQRDQEQLINRAAERAVEMIRPEFKAVNDRIDDLTKQVRQTNGTVGKHSELIGDLGLEDLSQEEREALPEVLREDVQMRRNRRAYDRRERRRTVLWQLMAVTIGTTGGHGDRGHRDPQFLQRASPVSFDWSLTPKYRKNGGAWPPGWPDDTAVYFSPTDGEGIHQLLLDLVEAAEHSIVINMYGFDDEAVNEVLLKRSQSDHV